MNTSVDKANWIILGLAGLVILIVFYGLSFAPAPTDFEAWMVEPGWVFFNTGHLTSQIFDNILETKNGCLGQGNVLHYLFGGVSYWLGHSIFNARMASFICAILLLIILYKFSLAAGNRLSASISVLCATASTAFFYSCHLARATIFVSTLHLTAFVCLWLYYYAADEKKKWFYAAGAGFASFCTIMFHLSGIAVIASIAISFLFINRNKKFGINHIIFLLAGLITSIIWAFIHIAPLGLDIFMQKMMLGSGYFSNLNKIINWVPLNYFFVSKLNFFYLFSFFISAYLLFRIKDHAIYIVAYLAVYACFSIFINEDPEPHKAMIFFPLMAVVIGQGLLKSAQVFSSFKGMRLQKVYVLVLVLFTMLGITAGIFKDLIYITKGKSVSYDKYLSDIKTTIPPGSVVLGQPHLWFGLAGRNSLLGGTYYLSRAHSYMKSFPRLRLEEGQPDLTVDETSKIFDFFKERGISYIVASEDMANLMRLNGLFGTYFIDRLSMLKKIPTSFYGHENFEPGFVYIYKINYY